MFLSKGKKQTWNSKHTSIIFSEGLDVFQVFFVFWFCVGNRWPVTFFFGRKRVGHVFFLKKTDACLEVGEDWYLWRHHGWRLEGNRAMTWLMYTGKTPGNNDSMLTLGIGPIFEVNEDASTTTSEFWWLTFLVFCFRIFSRTYPTNHWDELRRCISTLRLLRPMVVDLRLHLEIRKSSSNHPWVWHAAIVCEELEDCTFQPFLLPLSFVHNWPHWHPVFLLVVVQWSGVNHRKKAAVRWFVSWARFVLWWAEPPLRI